MHRLFGLDRFVLKYFRLPHFYVATSGLWLTLIIMNFLYFCSKSTFDTQQQAFYRPRCITSFNNAQNKPVASRDLMHPHTFRAISISMFSKSACRESYN